MKYLAAFEHKNFRLWYFGQLISLAGTWIHISSEGFFLYELTFSEVYLSYISMAVGLPALAFMLIGGSLADRMPRRTVMLISQSTQFLLSGVFCALVFAGIIKPFYFVLFSLGYGIVNALEMPTRAAIVAELVSKEHLPGAISLNATLFNLASALGPALGGLCYVRFGSKWCFLLNCLSYLVVLACLNRMNLQVKSEPHNKKHTPVIRNIAEGLAFIWDNPLMLALLLQVFFVSFSASAVVTFLPAWTHNYIGGDANANGSLYAARGIGAVVGAILMIRFAGTLKNISILKVGSLLIPVTMFFFLCTRSTVFSVCALFFLGLGQICVINMANTLTQLNVPESLRGRVMSAFSLALMASTPLGSLFTGPIAEYYSLAMGIAVSASILSVASMWFLYRLKSIAL